MRGIIQKTLIASLALGLLVTAAAPEKAPRRAPKTPPQAPKYASLARSESGAEGHDTPPPSVTTNREVLDLDKFPEESTGEAALSLIHFPWKELGYEVVFCGPRSGYRAMTFSGQHRIEVYVRVGETPLNLAYDLAHEFGHAFDLNYNNTQFRKRWQAARGISPSVPWFGCDRCSDYDTPAGDFAETFAYLLLGPGNYHSRIAKAPEPEQAQELTTLLMSQLPEEALAASEADTQ